MLLKVTLCNKFVGNNLTYIVIEIVDINGVENRSYAFVLLTHMYISYPIMINLSSYISNSP